MINNEKLEKVKSYFSKNNHPYKLDNENTILAQCPNCRLEETMALNFESEKYFCSSCGQTGAVDDFIHDEDKIQAPLPQDIEVINKLENNNGKTDKTKIITNHLLNIGVIPFLDQYKQPHISLTGDGSMVLPVKSSEFENFIFSQLYKNNISAGRDTIEQVKNNLSARAFFEKIQHPLSIRVAKDKYGDYWYDLGDGRIALIKEDGWAISNNPPILFKYLPEQLSQPLPIDGGNLDDLLEIINIKDQYNKLLLKILIIAGFIPGFSHPVIILHGQRGSAKSTCLRLFKSIVDPSIDDLLAPIKDINILSQIISHHWLTCFDNLSYLSRDMSDSLCRICTGGAVSTRQLYKDDSNIIRQMQNMVALNGINNVVMNPDLFERSIIIELKPISEEERKTDDEINFILEKIKPGVLGYCLKAAARAIKIKPSIRLPGKPRMASFAVWGCAIAEAIGENKEKFLEAFQANYNSQDEIAIEANPLALAIIQLIIEEPTGITATAEVILQKLNNINNSHGFSDKYDRAWPNGNKAFGKKFFELTPLLEKIGLKIINKRGAKRFKSIIPTDIFWERQELIDKENQQDTEQNNSQDPTFTDEPNNDGNDVSDVYDMKMF